MQWNEKDIWFSKFFTSNYLKSVACNYIPLTFTLVDKECVFQSCGCRLIESPFPSHSLLQKTQPDWMGLELERCLVTDFQIDLGY